MKKSSLVSLLEKFVLGFRIPIFAIIRNNNNPGKINNDKIITDPNAR